MTSIFLQSSEVMENLHLRVHLHHHQVQQVPLGIQSSRVKSVNLEVTISLLCMVFFFKAVKCMDAVWII